MKITVENLITKPEPEGLGYCCMYFFFSKYKRTAMIADRLGVTTRAVRKHKALFKEGVYECECKGNCLKKRIKKC